MRTTGKVRRGQKEVQYTNGARVLEMMKRLGGNMSQDNPETTDGRVEGVPVSA